MPSDIVILDYIKHPDYRVRKYYNDIALLRLSKRIPISAWIRPACLWQMNAINATKLTALGYGLTEYGQYFGHVVLFHYYRLIAILRWKTVRWVNEGQSEAVCRVCLFAQIPFGF